MKKKLYTAPASQPVKLFLEGDIQIVVDSDNSIEKEEVLSNQKHGSDIWGNDGGIWSNDGGSGIWSDE